MRFLPYVLAAFMIAPFAIWFIVASALEGSTTRFAGETFQQVVTLLPIAAVAIALLAWWMSRFIARTEAKGQAPAPAAAE